MAERGPGVTVLVRELVPGMRIGSQNRPRGVVEIAPVLEPEGTVTVGVRMPDGSLDERRYERGNEAALWVRP